MRNKDATMPLVSVITPVYNGVEHVGACMKSVAHSLTGRCISIEHILIDDGSTDETIATIEHARSALHDSGSYDCKLLHIPHSGKPAQARNCGIEAAHGKYIFCLDHDDILLQNTLRYLADHLESTTAEIAYGDFLRCDGNMAYAIGDDYCGRSYMDQHAALYSLFKGEHFFQHSLMFSKQLWQQVGGYDEAITFGEDFDLCVRFILAGHIPAHLPITTHFHRNHEKSMTACYVDRSVCPVWLAEHRAHYFKYLKILPRHLMPDVIDEIKNVLRITADTPLSSPPSREFAMTLTARRNNYFHIDSKKLCDIA